MAQVVLEYTSMNRSMRTTFVLSLVAILGCGSSSTETPPPPPTDSGDTGTSSDSADVATDSPIDSPADVPVDTPLDAAGCDCLASLVEWKRDGGFVASRDSSSISPCRTYGHKREEFGGSPPPPAKTCSQDLLKCGAGDALDIGDVQAALANADVTAALASAPVLFGRDNRPSDGQVFQIVVGGKKIEIGDDCGGASGCKPTPAGVAALRTLLENLDTAQLAISPCKEVFP